MNIYAGYGQNQTCIYACGGKAVLKDMEAYELMECYR